jgi:hypothetical protein
LVAVTTGGAEAGKPPNGLTLCTPGALALLAVGVVAESPVESPVVGVAEPFVAESESPPVVASEDGVVEDPSAAESPDGVGTRLGEGVTPCVGCGSGSADSPLGTGDGASPACGVAETDCDSVG